MRLGALSIGCAVALSAPGAGAHPGRLALDQHECAALDGVALAELVEIELGTLSLADTAARLRIRCAGDVATVSLVDAEGRTFPVESRVDFSRAGPGARERLVALAATELIAQAERAGRQREGTPAPRERAATRPEPAATPAPAARDRRVPRWEVSAAAMATVTGAPATLLGGVAAGARVFVAPPWSAAFDLRAERGATDAGEARVSWTLLGGSAAALFGPRIASAGAGFRVERLSLNATATAPDVGRKVTGTWAGPFLTARTTVELAAHVAFLAFLEAGYTTLPVSGTVDGGDSVVTVDGPWGTLGLGLAAGW